MKKLILLSIGILTLIYSCAPKPYSSGFPKGYFDSRYEDLLDEGDQILESTYQYVKVKTKDNKYIKRIYFPETKQIISEVTYRSAKFRQRHGLTKTWSDDGIPNFSVPYVNGKKSGIEKEYFKDGSFVEKGRYENGQEVGTWQFYDSQKRALSKINYNNGIRDGAFTEYDTLGQITNKGIYRADTIFEQSNPPKEISSLMPYLKSCHDVTPQAKRLDPCSEKKLLMAIYKNIRYPAKSREYSVQGRAIISFVIGEDGKMRDLKVIRGIDASITAELKRLFNYIAPKLDWEPGKKDGVKVPVYYVLPVKFQLQ